MVRGRLFRVSVGVFLAALSGTASGAAAQSGDPCATQNSTIKLNQCAQQKFEAQDRQLNAVYQDVMKRLSENQSSGADVKKLLVGAQRKWVEFRNADCSAQERIYQGGSVAAQVYADCMTAHTAQRIRELQQGSWQGN